MLTHRKGNSGPQIESMRQVTPQGKVSQSQGRERAGLVEQNCRMLLRKGGILCWTQEMGRVGRSGQLCWEGDEFYIEGPLDKGTHRTFVRDRQT